MTAQRTLPSWAALAACVLIAGCSDPAEKVHKSAASDAAASPAGKKPESATATAKSYVIRVPDSKIEFVGSKVTGSHSGGFKNFSGTFEVAGGKIASSTEIKINMSSTWSDNDRLTGHLKSPDFFDVAKFPTAAFVATAIESDKVTGNLTLHGVTKSISFPATMQVTDAQATVKAEFAINRRDFAINFPGRPNDLIRDNVVIKLDLKATPGAARPEDQLTNP